MLLPLESTAINKIYPADSSDFSLIGNTTNNYHLKLKESLIILNLKQSLNITKDSMPLHLFENDF